VTVTLDVLARVSSESDSAAPAPLQQNLRVLAGQRFHNLPILVTLKSVLGGLRERSMGVWQLRAFLACDPAPATTDGSDKSMSTIHGYPESVHPTTNSPPAPSTTRIELKPCGGGGLTTAPVLGSNSKP
jgi:hypothetical protein